MTAMTYTVARERLALTRDWVCQEHDPVVITRNREQAAVMMSLEELWVASGNRIFAAFARQCKNTDGCNQRFE